MRVYQTAVMGSGGVGKSAVTIRFINGEYLEMYDPTIEDSYRKQCTVDGLPCLLEILDTAGIDQYLSLSDLFIRESEGFILVFSLAARDTLGEIVRLRESILRIKNAYGGPAVPVVVVGNKADLVDEREVAAEHAAALARQWGAAYFETNIEVVFTEIVRRIRAVDAARGPRADVARRRGAARRCVIL